MTLAADDVLGLTASADDVEVVGELWNERRGGRSDDYSRDYARTFLVRTVHDLSASRVAALSAGVPRITTGYSVFGEEVDAEAVLVSIQCRQHDNHPNLWQVACTYSSKPANHPDYQAASPTERRSRRRYKMVREREYRVRDFDDVAIANSAGQPFDPVETANYYLSIEIKKNLPSTFPDLIENFLNVSNNDAAFGKPAYSLRVDDFFQDDEQFEAGERFWPSTLVLHCKTPTVAVPKPWHYRPLDKGTYQVVATKRLKLRDVNGLPIGVGLLNGAGAQLAFAAAPVFLDFRMADELTFALLQELFSP